MKCMNCGAEVGLLDEVCPYCGSNNIESADHRSKYKSYKRKSRETVEEAGRKYGDNKPLIAASIVMVFLIIGVIGMYFAADKTDYMDIDIAHSETLRKADEFKGILNGCLEAGDYIAFYDFIDIHHIYETDAEYEEYKILIKLASDYRIAMNSIESLVMYGEGSKHDKSRDIKSCSSDIRFFYTAYRYEENALEGYKYRKYAEDMENKLSTAVKIYFGLDDKGFEDYLALSENEQDLFVEEVFLGE